MSFDAVQDVLNKALTDETFRGLLQSDPDTALAPYDLSEGERAALKKIGTDESDGSVGLLDRRRSKSAAWLFWS